MPGFCQNFVEELQIFKILPVFDLTQSRLQTSNNKQHTTENKDPTGDWGWLSSPKPHYHPVVFLLFQGGAENEGRSTRAESAWLFRVWYNFDHKYPSQRPGGGPGPQALPLLPGERAEAPSLPQLCILNSHVAIYLGSAPRNAELYICRMCHAGRGRRLF